MLAYLPHSTVAPLLSQCCGLGARLGLHFPYASLGWNLSETLRTSLVGICCGTLLADSVMRSPLMP